MRAVVVGGGPAGMMAAYTAASGGHTVTLLEQNEKLGKKLYITGKGRCNLTNTADRDGFFASVCRNPRFLYSAYARFDNRAVMEFFEKSGVPLKEERGGRVFPASDKSSDILRAMERRVREAGVDVRLNTRVTGLLSEGGCITGVCCGADVLPCSAVILATGGVSYPQTGSTGDGLRFCEALGLPVEAPRAALIPFETEESWPGLLSGITLKNVTLSAYRGEKKRWSELGEMLFTHFGVSGPLVLTLSSAVDEDPAGLRLFIDFKPALTEEQLDARLVRELEAGAKKRLAGALSSLLPERLLARVFVQAAVAPELSASECTRAMRRALIAALKAMPLTVRNARPVEEAVVTRGGVSTRAVSPSSLAVKNVQGLYIAGEMLDVDARTGGYNLQIAWSTGALAGSLN